MKLIFSRKGFDSGYGRIPSPILPDGRLISFPIPGDQDSFTFADLDVPDIDIGALITDLSRGNYRINSKIHLDPDLHRAKKQRPRNWRPALGQSGSAQGHLAKQGVSTGDVFLFFGWFRQIERKNGRWCYAGHAPHLQVLFGWLEVDTVLPIVIERERCLREHPWISTHPHCANPGHYDNPLNTLYLAAQNSRYSTRADFGGGRFEHYSPTLCMTAEGQSRSVWSLPGWFAPSDSRAPLSYHHNPMRWRPAGTEVLLQTVAKGQEFVLDCTEYPQATHWLRQLIGEHA